MTEPNWAAPETDVLASAGHVLDGDQRGVLATVVEVDGNAYRRPGAKMVIPENGGGVGHVTAGCLEAEVQELARDVLADGEPRIETYDLRPESDDDVWGLGVGCNGIVDILLEPIDDSFRPVVDAYEAGEDVGVVTIVDTDDSDAVGARAYYAPARDEFSLGDGFPAGIVDRVRDVAGTLTEGGQADSLDVDDTTVFVDGIAVPEDLVVVGTGHDVGPITKLGAKADFRVTVVGFRGADARAERFPVADDVRSTSPARLREAFDFDEDTYVVVATHNFVDDRLAVGDLLETDVPYVGLMGPRERFEEMLDEFETEAKSVSDSDLARLYTPVGLDLGGGSPYEIAISVVGEVLAVSNDRDPQHLANREGPIHDRVDLSPKRSR